MRKIIGICSVIVLFRPFGVMAATCKVSDLQKCLDSVCALNIDLDAGDRCYSCGTSAAKRPEVKKYALGDNPVMQSLSVGKSSKNTLSDKELKNAPTDPGEKYQWATDQCINKIPNCTAEDVTNIYDKFIQQSCKVAMGDAAYAAALKTASIKKTSETCNSEFNICLLNDSKCGSDMLKCEEDSEFNRNFSACITEVSGCDDFASNMRDQMIASRNSMVEKKESRLSDLVKLHQMERENKFNSAKRLCDAGGMDGCILEMCGNMPNGLDEDGQCSDPDERMQSQSLCKFVSIACDKLK
jgi:hypothetical protein